MYCLFAISYAFLGEFSVEIPREETKASGPRKFENRRSLGLLESDIANSTCRGLYHDAKITASINCKQFRRQAYSTFPEGIMGLDLGWGLKSAITLEGLE